MYRFIILDRFWSLFVSLVDRIRDESERAISNGELDITMAKTVKRIDLLSFFIRFQTRVAFAAYDQKHLNRYRCF